VRVAQWGDGSGAAAVATSTGIAVTGRSTFCHLSVQALAEDGGETTSGYGVSVGREPADVAVDEAADDAAERATRLLGAVQPASGPVTLVLEPRMAATVFGVVAGMLNGESVLKGRSPFAERVGEQIASPLLTLVDDPTDARSLGADSHDGEGLATRRIRLVDHGVLQGFLHNTATGRRAGVPSTASAVRGFRSTPGVGAQALAVAPGSGSLDDLAAGVDHGVLVQSMTGLHSGVNPVSGDFSVGIEGVMVRGGATAEPIREATVASTIQRLLLDVSAVGGELEWTPGGTGAVALVIPGVTLSGS
jgi:PmbA protein